VCESITDRLKLPWQSVFITAYEEMTAQQVT